MRTATFLFCLLFFSTTLAVAQRTATLTLKNAAVLNNNTLYRFDIFALSTGAQSIGVGTSSLFFNYNAAGLGSPTLTNVNPNYTGNGSGDYGPMTVGIILGKIGVTIDFTSNGLGTTLSNTPPDGDLICTVNLVITNMAQTAQVTWDTTDTGMSHRNSSAVTTTLVGSDNSPLPITLSYLSVSPVPGLGFKISWATVSEQHNYGFWVQRSVDKVNGFANLEGSFIAGAGTTNARHEYSYTDVTAGGLKYYYRLQQVDLDGSSNYSEAIFPSGTTGVETENVPKVFALHQNYPNPFNPSTEIRFTVEKAGPATLKVYNMLGQEVASLFNGMAQPGRYYIEKFSADKLASGVYLYRLESNNKSAVSRMLLLK